MIAATNASRRKWYKEDEDFIISPPYHDFSLDLSLPSQGEHFGPPAPGASLSHRQARSGGLRRAESRIPARTYTKHIEGGPSNRWQHNTGPVKITVEQYPQTKPAGCHELDDTEEDNDSVYFSLPYGAPSGGQFFGPPDTGGLPRKGDREVHSIIFKLRDNIQNASYDGDGDCSETAEPISTRFGNNGGLANVDRNDPGYPGGPPPQRWQPGQGAPHQWEGMPSVPPQDNPNAMPPQMGPPPMGGFQQFSGYEGVGNFNAMTPMPPPPPPPPPQGDPPHMQFDSVANLSEEECREAMLSFVAENCCYGKKPATEMTFESITPSTALHYILETFCEGRNTGYVHDPFRGQPIDGPENGMPPPPWAIPCQPDSQFQDHTKTLEVPHTAVVKPCHGCDGRGFTRCHRCQGCGHVRCGSCGGDGRVTRHDPEGGTRQEPCGMCGGDGRSRCHNCGGDGRITCSTCDGYQRLKCYIRLTVSFANHKSDHIMEETDMPDELVRQVGGISIFEQTMLPVWPICAYPVKEINDNSIRLVNQHRTAFTSERQLNQRQTLRAVPVTEVSYKWDDVKTRFWVFGQERKVHSPDYPHQCCWGCTIL